MLFVLLAVTWGATTGFCLVLTCGPRGSEVTMSLNYPRTSTFIALASFLLYLQLEKVLCAGGLLWSD